MNQAVLYARFSPRPMICPACDKRMIKMRGLDTYECPDCQHTATMDDEQGSIQAQLGYAREHCNRQGYEVKSEHHDSALSGGNLDRPGLDAAIKALKRSMSNEGILRELKKRRHHMKPSIKKRKKQAEAARKRRKQARVAAERQ